MSTEQTTPRVRRCAYVINSLECGGAQLPIPHIVRIMQAHGLDVTVFALARKDGLAIPALREAGIRVRVRTGTTKDHVAAYRWLARELAAYKADLIWTSLTRASLLGQLVANRLRVPIVHWQHAARLKPANALLLKLCRTRTKLWVADSPAVEAYTRKTLGVDDNLTRWPIFRADPATPVATRWQTGETVRIGTIGRLHPVKGYNVLCEALALLKTHPDLPPFTLNIAGDGPDRAALQAQIDKNQLPVTLEGHRDDPLAFLATLHLYVQPSHWEGMCGAAHEAMSSGLPVIATPAGELPSSIVDGETGLIVPFNNAPALAHAIALLLTQPGNLASMGDKARMRILNRYGPRAFKQCGDEIMRRLSAGVI